MPISRLAWAMALVICSIQLELSLVPSSLNANIVISIIPMTVIAKNMTAGNDRMADISQLISILPAPIIMPAIIRMNPTGIMMRSCLFNIAISLRVAAIIIFQITLPSPASVTRMEPAINNAFL